MIEALCELLKVLPAKMFGRQLPKKSEDPSLNTAARDIVMRMLAMCLSLIHHLSDHELIIRVVIYINVERRHRTLR